MKKLLVHFQWYVHRMGTVESLFICTQEEIDNAIGKELYFGEILGKHSEIYGTLDKEDITVKSDDQDFIDKLQDIIGSTTISGHNPLSYFKEEDEEE